MKFSLLALVALTPALADQRGDTPGSQPSTPQEQLAKFHVPPGFEVQLVAAEPEIQKPINLNFDAAGRLWVTGSEMYPWPASTDVNGQPIADFDKGWRGIVEGFRVGDAPQPSDNARDTVRILSDFDTTGHARKVTIFADKLNIPSGIQPLPRKPGAKGDSAIVYSIPNIWLLTDVDGDGFAEKREPLYTGFGYTDTHGGSSSYIYWIDGWIYGTHGFRNHSEVRDRNGKVTIVDSGNTYRFRPDGTAFEIYAHGQTNPFGLAFDPLGNLFSADSHSKPVYMLLRGGYYEGIGKQHDGLGFAPRITDDDHGSSAIAGIAYYADDKWPEEFRGNLFNGNPVTQKINRDRLEWHGSTPKAIRMPDFLTCDDPWFRPVNLKLGPDGALYIADFYNPIIGHYEVPLTHPARDHTHGRIWRVIWRGEKANALAATAAPHPGSTGVPPVAAGVPPGASGVESASTSKKQPRQPRRGVSGGTPETTGGTPVLPGVPVAPDLTKLDAPALIEKLADPSLEVRRLATNELVDRVGKAAEGPISNAFNEAVLPYIDQENTERLPQPRISDLQAVCLQSAAERVSPELSLAMLVSPHRTPDENAESLCKLPEALASQSLRYCGESAREIDSWNPIDLQVAIAKIDKPHLQLAAAYAISMTAESLGKASQSNAPLRIDLSPPPIPGVPKTKKTPEQLRARRAEYVDYNLREFQTLVRRLIVALSRVSPEDSELQYSLRVALRDCLLVPGSYHTAADVSTADRPTAETIAPIFLAVHTPESAEFLLTHLQRTKLETPRAGEYLKHVVLYLPAEKLDAVAKLVAERRAPARRVDDPDATPGRAGARRSEELTLATNLAEAVRQRGDAVPQSLVTWSEDVVLEALTSDDKLTKPAIAAVRDLKLDAKLVPLAKIARDEFRDDALRLAALEAVANLPASHDLLSEIFTGPKHLSLRKRAAELLAQNGDTTTVLAAIPQAPWELAVSIASGLARTDAGATALLDAIESGKAPARVLTNRAVAGPFFSQPKALQERAKAVAKDLPPEDARLDKVIAERAELYRKAEAGVSDPGHNKPEATHGAQIFQQQCAVCHRFRNAGGNVGPNLDGVVARGPQRLIEDILDPNRNVDPGFRQTIIETTSGQTFAGVNLRAQGETVLLTDATGKEITIPKSTIKTQTQTQLSLMPPAFESTIPAGEFNDLLAYLLGPAK